MDEGSFAAKPIRRGSAFCPTMKNIVPAKHPLARVLSRTDRKKLLADPITVFAIIVVLAFLLLFVVYPLCTILTQSFTTDDSAYVSGLTQNGKALMAYAGEDEALMDSPFYRLCEACAAYSKEYNARGKIDSEAMKEIRAQIDEAYAQINADDQVVTDFVAAVNANAETPVTEERCWSSVLRPLQTSVKLAKKV